jgi:hypothetical protein
VQGERISANNVADSAPQHMKSRKICLGSYDLWLKHKAQHGAKKRKQPSDAEMHVFDHMNSQGRNRSITEYRFDRSALMKFLESAGKPCALPSWIRNIRNFSQLVHSV